MVRNLGWFGEFLSYISCTNASSPALLCKFSHTVTLMVLDSSSGPTTVPFCGGPASADPITIAATPKPSVTRAHTCHSRLPRCIFDAPLILSAEVHEVGLRLRTHTFESCFLI